MAGQALKSLTGFDANNQRLLAVASAVSGTDGVNKNDLDNAVRGLDWKAEVVAASTGNVSLAAPGGTFDGIALSAGMQTLPSLGTVTRVLLMNQTAPAENGIYDWNGAAAALTRAVDADSWAELTGSTVTIQRGTTLGDRVYRVNSDDGGTLNTTAVTFAQVGAGGSAKTAGNGLTETGSTYDVGAGTGIVVGADTVSVDTATVTMKKSFNCTNASQVQSFVHNLGTLDVQVFVREVSSGRLVWADPTVVDANTVSCDFGATPTASQYRVSVQG